MQDSAHDKPSRFSLWMRTGRWPDPQASEALERKFNPWHDQDDGRFTFAGSGRHFGSAGQARSSEPIAKRPPPRVDVPGRPPRRIDSARSNVGSFGGAGASGSWPQPVASHKPPQSPIHPSGQHRVPFANGVLRESTGIGGHARSVLPFKRIAKSVVRNGYRFEIDDFGRTWRVSGTIVEYPQQRRSRRSQLEAGGRYRLPTDDGGHFIARRFKGPTEAFNHFAQDADFNRKTYKLIEEQWSRARRRGQVVTVKIAPVYQGRSLRPSSLNIWYSLGNKKHSISLPNARGGK